MNTCPFCQIEISEELAIHGGFCPSCLIEIPGEESVTNPGVQNEGEPGPSPEQGSGKAGIIAALVVIGVAGAVWGLNPPASEPATPVEATSVRQIPQFAHEDQPVAPAVVDSTDAAEGVANKAAVQTPRGRARKLVKSGTKAPPLNSAVAKDASVLPGTGSSGVGSAPSDVFATIGAAPRSRAQESIVLTDSLQIDEMIGRVLNRGAKQLEQCYTQALKMQEGLKGAWYVDFTITPAGKPVTVSVEALGPPHAGIERCIERKVSRWRFQRVSEHVDVARTYRFGT